MQAKVLAMSRPLLPLATRLLHAGPKAVLPGADLWTAKVLLRRSVPHSAAVRSVPSDAISSRSCARVIPDSLLRLSARMRSDGEHEMDLARARRVELVDGKVLRLHKRPRAVASPCPQGSEREAQHCIQRQRFCAKVYESVLHFVSRCNEPYLRLPVWRLARIQQSTDMKILTIVWTIDSVDEARQYREGLCRAWLRIAPELRHRLATGFSLRFVPHLRVEYKDATAVDLAHRLGE